MGSIAIAFWIIFLLVKLVLATNSIVWLLFLAVYGTDTVCTILHRLYLKQNIFEAHRLHLYQVLSNEYQIQHRLVSLYYALAQVGVSVVVVSFYHKVQDIVLFLIVIPPLLLIYSLKFYLLKKSDAQPELTRG